MFRIAVAVLFAAVSASPAADPPQSIQPTAAFAQACYGKQRPMSRCDTQAIANINSARAAEGVGPIALPGDYSSLTLWMYDDGPGGVNGDCVNPGDPGCWGHRHNILGSSWLTAGAGHDHASLAELFVQ